MLIGFAAIIIIFFSCNTKNTKQVDAVFNKDLKADTLVGEVLTYPLISKSPVAIHYSPSGLFSVTKVKNNIVQLIDTNTGKPTIAQYNEGKADDEFLGAVSMDYNPVNSTYCIVDIYKQRISLLGIENNQFNLVNYIDYSGITPSVVRNITDSSCVILTSIPYQALLIYDKHGIKSQIPYRIIDEPDLDYFKYYYPSEIDLCTKEQLIVAADPYLPYVAAFSYKGDSIVKLWDKMVFKPKYSFRKRWRYIENESCLGFDCMAVSDKFIYLTYFGISSEQWNQGVQKNLKYIRLMIFDFNGNFVNHFFLDHSITFFSVTPDDRVLYGLKENPDRYIVKYHLK